MLSAPRPRVTRSPPQCRPFLSPAAAWTGTDCRRRALPSSPSVCSLPSLLRPFWASSRLPGSRFSDERCPRPFDGVSRHRPAAAVAAGWGPRRARGRRAAATAAASRCRPWGARTGRWRFVLLEGVGQSRIWTMNLGCKKLVEQPCAPVQNVR